MSEVLIKKFPKAYTISMPEEPKTKVEVFLKNLYELSISDYKKLCETVDQESKVGWWKQLQLAMRKGQAAIKNGHQKDVSRAEDKSVKYEKTFGNEKGSFYQKKMSVGRLPAEGKKRSLGRVYNK